MKVDVAGQKWQNPATIGTSYGYMIDEEKNDDYKSPTELVHLLCDVVSKNGNLLLNIGPRPNGTIPEGMQTRLLAMGEWLNVNGKAICGKRPWITSGQKEPNLRFTTKSDTLYAIALEKPGAPFAIALPADKKVSGITMLGPDEPIVWSIVEECVRIAPPEQWPLVS